MCIPKLKIDQYMVRPEASVCASAQLCWTHDALRVYMTAMEHTILARFNGEYDAVCRDSCLEFFFSPMENDNRYFNIEINPNGACFFGFGYDRESLIRLHPWDIRNLLDIHTCRTNEGWSVAFSMPLELIRLFFPNFTLCSGIKMRANFYKCGDDLEPNHELMWNRIENNNPDFHQSQFFGELILG